MGSGRGTGSGHRAKLERERRAAVAGQGSENKVAQAKSKQQQDAESGAWRYLCLDGLGEPRGAELDAAAATLRAVAADLRSARRFGGRKHFETGTLETIRRSAGWTLRIRVPASVTSAELQKGARECGVYLRGSLEGGTMPLMRK